MEIAIQNFHLQKVLGVLARPFSTVLDTPVDPSSTPPTRKASVFENALNAVAPRTNWTKGEIAQVYNTPLIDLTHASVRLSSLHLGEICERSSHGVGRLVETILSGRQWEHPPSADLTRPLDRSKLSLLETRQHR
jgi:hypothetical protein